MTPTRNSAHHAEDDERTATSRKAAGLWRRAFTSTAPGGASWSGRNSYRVSSAFASAPAGAEEARRQGAPDRLGGAEHGLTQDNPQPPSAVGNACPSCGHPIPTAVQDKPLSGREPDAPPLPAPLYRKRTKETRDRVRSIRFTPTAERVIDTAARARGQYFAGYVGDVAYAHALGRTAVAGSPEDDPARPIVETVERLIAQLRRTGNNLNQITHAINSGTIPHHAERVLGRVEEAVEEAFVLLDGFVGEDGAA